MCSPQLIATLGLQSLQFRQQAAQAEYQAGVDRYNARVASNEAEQVRTIGAEEENRARLRTAQLIGQQTAQIGASGVRIDEGSPAQLVEDTAIIGEADALRVRGNFARQAESLDIQSDLLENQAEAAEQAAGNLSFTSNLLTGGFGFAVASRWYNADSSAVQTP